MNKQSKLPQSLGFYMPAEWYEHQACWMGWPCHLSTWKKIGLDPARQAFAKVANAISEFEPVHMLVHPQDIPGVKQLCSQQIQIYPYPLDDSWLRDTGPTFLLHKHSTELAAVNWIHNAWGGNYTDCNHDNQIPAFIVEHTQCKQFDAPFVMEGGSFHVDGQGRLITTRECLLNPNRNPSFSQEDIETHLKTYLGISSVIWLEKGLVGDETDGHVDEVATFIGPNKVLALITENQDDENYEILKKNYQDLVNYRNERGQALDVHTIEMPSAMYLGEERLTLSYINFYLANHGIVMPAFGQAKFDQDAFQKIKDLFPGHKILQIDALDIFSGGGGIHCITQQQPKSHRGK